MTTDIEINLEELKDAYRGPYFKDAPEWAAEAVYKALVTIVKNKVELPVYAKHRVSSALKCFYAIRLRDQKEKAKDAEALEEAKVAAAERLKKPAGRQGKRLNNRQLEDKALRSKIKSQAKKR
jgi:hypothetical protein